VVANQECAQPLGLNIWCDPVDHSRVAA
jgi:hypothetical protein